MRRIVGFVLLGLGAFLLTMSVLLKWYAYPSLAVVPIDQDSVTTSVGTNMTYFSKADLAEKQDTLTSTIHTVGDVKAAEDQGHNVAVFNQSTATATSDGTVISTETVRVPFDRTTGQAVDCCGAQRQTNQDPAEDTKFEGLVFKFPFNTQKKSYDWWDGDLGRAEPMKYDGVEKIGGLLTYRFTQTVDSEQVGSVTIPSRVLGEPAGQMLSAEAWYSNQRTYNVEPETGVIIKAVENPNTVLMYDGTQRIVATQGTTGFTDDLVNQNVKDYKPKASQLHLVRVILPLAGLILGLLFVLVGAAVIALARRRDDRSLDDQIEDLELPHHTQTI
jgi:hypothetical protein